MADRVHSRFISVIWEQKPPTLLKALMLIEDTLRKELEKVTITDAIADISHRQQNSIVVYNNSGGKSNKPKHSVEDRSSSSPKQSKEPTCVFCGKHPLSYKCTAVTSPKDRREKLRGKAVDLVNRLALVPIEQRKMSIRGLHDKHTRPSFHDIVKIDIVTDRGKYSVEAVVHEGSSVNSISTHPLDDNDLSVIQSTIGTVSNRFSNFVSVETDLLLSVTDTMELLENSKETKLPSGCRLFESPIGPIVVGSSRGSRSFKPSVSALTVNTEPSFEQKLERLFSVDPSARVYGTTEKESRKVTDELVNKHFEDTLLVTNLYVDNVIINVDRPLSIMYTQSKQIFESMPMNLRDYASNDPDFISTIPESDRSSDNVQKLLGLLWNNDTDQLFIKIPISSKDGEESKRSMLSKTASPFDPLGFLNPLLLPPRLSIQNLWNTSLKWDEKVDPSTRDAFHSQMSDVESFSLPIDRYSHLSDSDEIILVTFSDASKQAMATCIYSWSPSSPPALLISKCRLAPIKATSTIPKMELESLVMSHSLLRFTVDALRKEFTEKPIHVYTYSDSAVVLRWCRPEFSKPVGPFVSNRINKIKEITSELSESHSVIYHYPRHVRSEFNPADHSTRGLSAKDMNNPNHQWWIGPDWLKTDPSTWPNESLSSLQSPLIEDFPLVVSYVSIPQIEPVIVLSKHSSLHKTISVTALVYRFISCCGKRNPTIREKLKHLPNSNSHKLIAVEKRFAHSSIIRLHQDKYIPYDDSLRKKNIIVYDELSKMWKSNSRLTNSNLPSESKSPIFIPTSRDATRAHHFRYPQVFNSREC
ncbi:hypothetical protein PENTCL1PPCAC_1531 [Pristionchus entomophagus]|uniref:RNase H type-1 domain-containing protein n=1 Tax=Pristionchus entomophagus TaxID=358040 RepID=A0AAV5SI89_9BILA|nr:hypothetical protein PENTCL1PPCAC_1531 [Pristionchus entomophagus]